MSMLPIPLEPPFSLPLARDAFGAAIRKGHGRALMHVRGNGASGVEDLIIDACLHDRTFDPQCEEERAPWMIEIMDATGLEEVVCGKLVEKLSADAGPENFWDHSHLCQLALALTRKGHSAARTALYRGFRMCEDSADILAAEEIIELDGADGLLFVAGRIGEWLADESELWVDDYLLRSYDEHHDEGSAERLLNAASKQDDRIAVYLDHIRSSDRGKSSRYKKPDVLRFGVSGPSRMDDLYRMSADELIRFVEAGAPGFGKPAFRGWGRRASEHDLRQVADRLFRESDPDRLARFLGVFLGRPLPEFDLRLLRFAEHPDRDIRWVTNFILAQHRHPAVRSLALERVRSGRHYEGELKLLCKCFEPGDWSLIRAHLRWPDEENEVHWMLDDLLDVSEDNPIEELAEALLLVYEHSPCSSCRGRAVSGLLGCNHVPEWLIEECRFDAVDEIRKKCH